MKKIKYKNLLILLIIAALSLMTFIAVTLLYKQPQYKTYVNFLKDLNSKNISTVYMTNSPKIKVELKNGKTYNTDNPRSDTFKEELLKNGIKVSENTQISPMQFIPIAVFFTCIVAVAVIFIKSSSIASKGLLSVDSLDTENVENTEYNFSNIAGNEEAKESIKDIVDFLKNPEKYASYGARMPKGVILYGEPGTGKTLLAKATAGESHVPFFAMSGSDFIQVYVGVGASRIRQLFKKAKSHGKAVIFIDEIDAIGKKRDSSKYGGSDERDQTLNALLTEMSGFNEKEGIIVIAATNRLDMLDPALLRPGRFDRHVEIMLPDVSAREKILNLYLKNKPTDNIDVKDWAKKTVYFSGAKIENLINEAAIIACKEGSKYIKDTHIDKAFSIVLAGYEKTNRDFIKISDKKITAFHEIGHTLISLKVMPNEKISKVTIIPSTKGAGGYTLSIPEDRMYQNKDYLKRRIMVLLGGRAAEDIIFGENSVTTGAFNDLKTCTSIVSSMITQYGMGSTIGLLNLDELSQFNLNCSSSAVEECKKLVEDMYIEVKNILIQEKTTLEKLASALIQKETLFHEDILKLL